LASTAAIAVVTLAVLKWIDIETIRRRRATLLVNGAADPTAIEAVAKLLEPCTTTRDSWNSGHIN
jgi:hypothetical protein